MSIPSPSPTPTRVGALATALWLAGCAAPPPVAPPPVPPPVAAAPSVPPPAPTSSSGWTWSPQLDAAAQRLRDTLGGSGVEVAQTTDQRLWLSLPGAETFPIGRSALTRPGGAWLDKVAQALRTLPQAEIQIVGPLDARQGGGALALDRAASARDWMVMRGVPARRVQVSGQVPRGKTAPTEPRLDILIGERASAAVRR
jgi:outer membrane protein OmpA-like peptidoglycan-associated protein